MTLKLDNAAISGVDRAAIPGVDDGRTTGVDADKRTDAANGRAGAPEEAEVAHDGSTTGVCAEVADDGRTSQAAVDREMQEKYGPRNERYDMRQRREPDYSHLFANTHADEPLVTPQMSMKKGLQVFGEDGIEAPSRKKCYNSMTRK
jgi:hypothetical protein